MIVRLLAAVAVLSAPAAALAEWQVAETQHFIIYSERSRADIEKLAERVESYDRLMRMATSIPEDRDPVKVRIYELEDLGDIQKAANSDGGIGGFYDSNILGPFLVAPRKTTGAIKEFTPEIVLHHEYAHHFMLQYFPAIYPGWYTEGFAELIGSSKQLEDGRIGYGMPAKGRGNEIAAYWVPLRELLVTERPYALDTYGQGWALTHFFTFNKERSAQLRQYLYRLSSGKSLREAAQVFGDLNALNREARRYVTSGAFEYKPVKVEIARPVVRKIRGASAAEADLVPELASFGDDDLSFIDKPGWRERARRFRERTLISIRNKVARHPGDAFGHYFLAEAENAAGNFDRAEGAADRALAVQPTHVRALARKSILLARRAGKLDGAARPAQAAEARRLATRANRLDVEDPLPLVAFYESYRLAGEKPTPQAILGLEKAVATYPLDMNIRQRLVDQMAADGRYAEAIALLQRIANATHSSPRRSAARAQLAKLRAMLAAKQPT